MKSFVTYLKNVRGELAHVVWPDRKQAIIHTVLIIIVSALVALMITGFDFIFTSAANHLILGF